MAEFVLIKQRIEPGKTDRLREWMAEVRSRRAEAIETLQHEGVYTEASFIESRDDGDYLLTFMEAADIDRAFEAYRTSSHEIDRENRDVLDEVLADEHPERDLELLYRLTNPDRP